MQFSSRYPSLEVPFLEQKVLLGGVISVIVAMAHCSFSPPPSLHRSAARLGSCFSRAVVFPAKFVPASLPCPALRRKYVAQYALPMFAEVFHDGIGADAQESLVRLRQVILEGAIDIGLPLPADEAATWGAMAVPVVLWYMVAAPGTAAGLVDFLYAPIHAQSFRSFSADEVEIGRQMGEGSFGVVYEGFYGRGRKGAKKDPLHVVLKKAKARVKGASEIHDSEIHMNYRLQRTAPGACAEFLGTMQVNASQARGKLSEGVWLVWNFQGDRTLDFYLKQKNFPENVSEIILGKVSPEWNSNTAVSNQQGVSKEEVFRRNATAIRVVFKQILNNLQDLHRSGVVHRDVKPLNLILAQDTGKVKFIDFGACVDLRSGYNYVPNETVIDPTYAAPEHYIMPTNTPQLPPDPLCTLVSPVFWHLNTPDRFDIYSAGLILMQMSMKRLRHDAGLQSFNTELKQHGYDLNAWRTKCRFGKEEFAYLDADGGAGWELARALLQPRHDKGFFIWPSLGDSRPSASAALRHPFFREPFTTSKLFPELLPGPVTPEREMASPLQVLPSPMLATEKLSRALHSVVSIGHANPVVQMKDTAKGRKITPVAQSSSEGHQKAQKSNSVDEAGLNFEQVGATFGATLPTAAASALALATGWLILSGLKSSAHASYEVGRLVMSSSGISGSAFLAFFLVIKPWLEEQEVKSRRTKLDKDLVAAASNQRLEGAFSDKYKSSESEQMKSGLVEAVQALETQMSSLEALMSQEQQLSQQQQELVQKMESLLLQPSLASQSGLSQEEVTDNYLQSVPSSAPQDLPVSS